MASSLSRAQAQPFNRRADDCVVRLAAANGFGDCCCLSENEGQRVGEGRT
jgi:hypothetical protein